MNKKKTRMWCENLHKKQFIGYRVTNMSVPIKITEVYELPLTKWSRILLGAIFCVSKLYETSLDVFYKKLSYSIE